MEETWGLPAQPSVATACAVAYSVPPPLCLSPGWHFLYVPAGWGVLQEPHQLRHCSWGAGLWGVSGVLQATFHYIENRTGNPTLGWLCSQMGILGAPTLSFLSQMEGLPLPALPALCTGGWGPCLSLASQSCCVPHASWELCGNPGSCAWCQPRPQLLVSSAPGPRGHRDLG